MVATITEQEVKTARGWAVANAAATISLIAWNYVAGSGMVFGTTIGELSRKYNTSFTPASYAFSIWGLIYLGMLAQAVFHLREAFRARPGGRDTTLSIRLLGPRIVITQFLCASWLVAWLSEHVALSMLLMIALYAALMSIVIRWNMEREDPPWKIIALEWWPICWYAGWINVALLANIGAYMAAYDVQLAQTAEWALSLGAILVVMNIGMIFWRNMREYSLVAVWALVAVFVRHSGTDMNIVAQGALLGAAVVFLASAYHGLRNFTWPPSEDSLGA